jgi:hypothetical protein
MWTSGYLSRRTDARRRANFPVMPAIPTVVEDMAGICDESLATAEAKFCLLALYRALKLQSTWSSGRVEHKSANINALATLKAKT